MKNRLTVIRLGENDRMRRVLADALMDANASFLLPDFDGSIPDVTGKRLLFAIAADEYGADAMFVCFLRYLRANPGCLAGCTGGVLVDSAGESATKDAARELILAANAAGCRFVGRSLVEATASLNNFRVLARVSGSDPMSAYGAAAASLAERIADTDPVQSVRPSVAVLHASARRTSNTLYVGGMVLDKLYPCCDVTEVALLNGVSDCYGCGHTACRHFGEQAGCFYGGAVPQEVYPAVENADAVLWLCPNYNDALGANLSACINRLSALSQRANFFATRIYAVVVSGYGGGDIVAKQLLGALNVNKSFQLPPGFVLYETANDPGDAARLPGVVQRAGAFGERIRSELVRPV